VARLPSEQFSSFGDDIAPNFELQISGKDTSGATEIYEAIRPLVVGVTFEDDEEMSSLFELTVENQPDTGPGRPVDWRAVIDSRAFAEGNAIDLWMGYGSSMTFMDRAEIVKWLPTFPETGPASFRIKGFDGRHRMMEENRSQQTSESGARTVRKDPATLESVVTTKTSQTSRTTSKRKRKTFYKNLEDELIVIKVAEKYDNFWVEFDIPESRRRTVHRRVTGGATRTQHVIPTRVQSPDVTDWQFLRRLAKINGFDLWVDWSLEFEQWTVHFKRRDETGAAGYAFEYNGADGSLLSAEPDFSIKDQSTDVEVLVFDKKKRKVERTVISGAKKAEEVQLSGARIAPGQLKAQKEIAEGASVRFTAFGQSFEAFSDRPFSSRKQAETFVQNLLRERERDFLIVQGKVVGTPDLRARQFHELRGLGKRLDGLYRFTNVRHMMQPGAAYTCEFTAHKVLGTLTDRSAQTSEAK
jgi:hypothetical protein